MSSGLDALLDVSSTEYDTSKVKVTGKYGVSTVAYSNLNSLNVQQRGGLWYRPSPSHARLPANASGFQQDSTVARPEEVCCALCCRASSYQGISPESRPRFSSIRLLLGTRSC